MPEQPGSQFDIDAIRGVREDVGSQYSQDGLKQ
jgi:hypothetical protein